MATEITGDLSGAGLSIGIAVARFNEFVTTPLRDGAIQGLEELGVPAARIVVAWVPGAVELPGACQELLETHDLDAVIALGCVIRGETSHYDYVCQAATRGCTDLALAKRRPVIFGVLTCENREQALARAGEAPDNKGYEAALTGVEMANLYRALRRPDDDA